MSIKQIWDKLKGVKNIQIILAVIISCIALIIYFSPTSNSVGTADALSIKVDTASDLQAKELADALCMIKGAGNVKVMITYESGTELVPAYEQNVTEAGTKNNDENTYSKIESNKIITVYQQGGSGALILKEKKPEIKGVIVIAEGAADLSVKLNLYKAVQTVLQINPGKVDVFEMK